MLPGQKISPDFMMQVVRRRYPLLVVPFVVGAFAALVVSSRLPNQYQADVLMRLIPQRVPDSYVRSTVILPIASRLESVTREVLSRTRLEELIGEFDLFADERTTRPIEEVVARLSNKVQVEMVTPARGQPVDAFHIRFTYVDPVMAARVANRLGDLFVQENARDRGDLADATNEFLESQLAGARTRLEQQERKLEAFRQQHAGRLPSQLDSNAEAMRSAQMQAQALVESTARDRDRKLMLERMYREAEAEPVPVVPSAQPAAQAGVPTAVTGTAQQQFDVARSTLASLETRLRPEHPDIIRAKRQISELEKKVAAEAAQASSPAAGQETTREVPRQPVLTPEAAQRTERLRQMRLELESLDRQVAFKEREEQRLRGVIAEYQQRIETVPGLESEWAVLNRDYETVSNSYKELLGKSEQSRVAAELEKRQIGEQFRVVDPARVPLQPISPVRIQINAIGAGAGLFFGLLLVVVFELLDTSFRTRNDILDVLALPVLARVPRLESGTEIHRRARRKLMLSAAVAVIVSAGGYAFWAMRLWKFVV